MYFYDVVKYQLKHYKKRKGSIINAGAIINGLEYKTKSEPHSAYEILFVEPKKVLRNIISMYKRKRPNLFPLSTH